jgi:hypothetical protein
MFKRLYWSGSNTKFHCINWYGDHGQYKARVLDKLGIMSKLTANYHINVVHAFETAPHVKKYIDTLNSTGAVVVAAHSLGCMLASAAITLEGAQVERYMIINGAVAIECYDPDVEKDFNMLHPDWADYYPFASLPAQLEHLLASEWHKRFGGTDHRNKLTWRGLFKNWGITAVYNYYSEGEDVVGDIPYAKSSSVDAIEWAWGAQEKLKGSMSLKWLLGHGIDTDMAGWGFNEHYDVDGERMPPSQAANIPLDDLKTQPFFRKAPGQLFSPTGTVAAGYASKHRFEILAKGIPARTNGIAANEVDKTRLTNFDNRNMQDNYRNGWFTPKVEWGHGHFLDVAYIYTYPMYDRLVDDGGLK